MRHLPALIIPLLAMLLVACGGSSDKPAAASYQLSCRGPATEVLPGTNGDVIATLTAQGKPVSGKGVRWSVTSASGPGGLSGDSKDAVTDAAGQARTVYLVAFDAGWRGEVAVSAETTDLQPPARCEARFQALSPGMPPPPTPTAKP